MRDGHARVGWGMATSVYPARRSPASARARLNPDGSALVEAGSQDLGGGTYTIMTQIAADQLGLPVSAVTFLLAIRAFPKLPSGGSQTAATCGSAVYEATRALRQKILDLAHVPAADADQLRIENGRVTAGSTSVPIADLLKQTGQSHLDAQASTKPGDETKQYSMFSFGAQFADLGQIEVTRMTGVFDAGRILNAKTARSQFIGGMGGASAWRSTKETITIPGWSASSTTTSPNTTSLPMPMFPPSTSPGSMEPTTE